jgi:uncharacterized repeat protein (TIGR04138 family)
MYEAGFEEAIDQIRAKDPRFEREAYRFVREALDYTQKTIGKDTHGRIRHVTGQELLRGIRDFALDQFGPMAMTVLEEWGIRASQDFGEIVFNMVEVRGAPCFSPGDIKDVPAFAAKLKRQSDSVSQFLWTQLTESSRQAVLTKPEGPGLEALLVKELNEIIQGRPIYQEQRFAGVALSDQAKSLVAQALRGVQLARLNRVLLEDAYPLELAKSHGLLAKTQEDSRADFESGYDFYEAFRKPFLPASKLTAPAPQPKPTGA